MLYIRHPAPKAVVESVVTTKTDITLNFKSLCLILILSIVHDESFASSDDSLLINEVKKYIVNKMGCRVPQSFYTRWSRNNKPTVLLFVSSASRVSAPAGLKRYITHFGSDEEAAKKSADEHTSLGYHTFVYKTFATSSTQLNTRFISYSGEEKCFIMLHEFIHRYIRDLNLNIPYEYEEALGDVLGNYGSIEFVEVSGHLSEKQLRKQKSHNEMIYRTINRTIKKIDADTNNVTNLNLKCQKRIEKIIAGAGLFLNDRFGYNVNNAYLLKNSPYSKNYFMLKKIFYKSGSTTKLLQIMKSGPPEAENFEKYLKTFL